MNKMNIVMTTDENYIIPTMVTISSIMSTINDNTLLNVYILCAPGLNQSSRNRLKSIEKGLLTLKFVEIRDKRLDEAVTTAHIPVASYYRLYMSRFIDEERCLFIDGDMIVKKDLTQIYNTDLSDFYVAGVKDLGVQCNMSQYIECAKYLDIPTMDTYVNAGFMLFNLQKIREDQLDCKMVQAIDKGYKYMDQDIINKYCYGKIKFLPLKYNFLADYYVSIDRFDSTAYSEEELVNIKDDIAVLHFAGGFKPWLCRRIQVNQCWWDEANNVLDNLLYKEVENSAKEFEHTSDWKNVLNTAQNRDVVIFGFSEIGRGVADRLVYQEETKIVAFADNDDSKEGMNYEGIYVYSAAEAFEKYPDALFIISSQNGFRQINLQLRNLGISKENIIRYIHKDISYYERLDEKYIEYEKMLIEA